MSVHLWTYARSLMHTLEEKQKACSEEDQKVAVVAPDTHCIDLTAPIEYAFVPNVAKKAAAIFLLAFLLSDRVVLLRQKCVTSAIASPGP